MRSSPPTATNDPSGEIATQLIDSGCLNSRVQTLSPLRSHNENVRARRLTSSSSRLREFHIFNLLFRKRRDRFASGVVEAANVLSVWSQQNNHLASVGRDDQAQDRLFRVEIPQSTLPGLSLCRIDSRP